MHFDLSVNVFHHYGGGKPPPRPRMVSVGLLTKRQFGMTTFGFKVVLPPPGASDVTQRELTITVNGGDPPLVKVYAGDALLTDELVFNADDKLVMTLVDIDGHANRSPASAAFSYAVIDDVPPPQPGALGVQDKRQIDTPTPPAPVPPPAPTP